MLPSVQKKASLPSDAGNLTSIQLPSIAPTQEMAVGLRSICSSDTLSQQSSTPVALIGGAGVPGRARLRGTRVLGATFRSFCFPRLREGRGGKRGRKEEEIVFVSSLLPVAVKYFAHENICVEHLHYQSQL